MKLLIITQIVDYRDSNLGFFCGWIAEFAKHCEQVTVICLQEGEHALPSNVKVWSLGKEKGSSRLTKIFRFYKYLYTQRKNYDAVFVHMNQEYVLMGAVIWKLLGKKIFMWRNHYKGDWRTALAVSFCTKVFYTSAFSYTAHFDNAVQMPVGVDTDSVHEEELVVRKPRSILFLGRLDHSKHPDLLLQALGIVAQRGVVFEATFVGGQTDPQASYKKELQAQAERLGIAARVVFVGAVPNNQTYFQYRAHEIYVNCSQSGMFDKTLFKAIACGCLVLASSKDFKELAEELFWYPEGDALILADKLEHLLSMPQTEVQAKQRALHTILAEHTLQVLMSKLHAAMEEVLL